MKDVEKMFGEIALMLAFAAGIGVGLVLGIWVVG